MEREERRLDQRKSRRAKKYRRRRIVQSLACLVVFCTTYALILPAITLEKPSYCGFKEHKHSDKCYTQELVCEKEEGKGHTHSDACYTEHQNLICGLEESEGHSHTDECYQTYDNLICELEENEEHTHGPECYEQVIELVCSLEETEGHTHTDACYETVRELSCGLEEAEGHKHTKECYEKVLTCKKEEHEHTLECFSNPKADIETQADWEKTLPKEEELTGIWADDLLKVAESQLDYVESKHNYLVADDDVTMGYTRYGAWYGMPYEDWCAMFIEFCLHYAGIPKADMPRAASCTKWVRLLTEKEMYMKAEDGRPEPGDLVFFDVDKEKGPDHVGIVIEVDEKDGIKTIEGNSGNKVAHREYKWDDKTLYGYGLLPENPNPEVKAQLEEHEPEELDPEEMAELHPEAAESEAPAEEQKTVEFTGETDTVTVRVEAPEGAFPEGTTMEVRTVAAEDVMDAVTGAVDGEVAHVDAVDIKFVYEGEEIEPALPIQVFMTPIEEQPAGAPKVIHVQDDGSATEVDNVTTPEGEEGLQFEADSFSVYALVYTVDYEYSVNGEVYQFSLPGGGYVSFADLVEALGIIGNTTITLDDFMAGVASVEFSSPKLVDVSMVDADTTVGQIKESRGLECQYSAELTEEQIAEINSTEVQSGDWALISVQPFTSEESLTVTMKDGEVFTVRVTDYQISTNVLTVDGKNYKITVTFDDAAEIPGGTKLVAEEIEPSSDEYLQHYGKAWAEVNKEYLEQEEKKNSNIGGLDEYEDIRPVNLDDARFFHISLIYNNEEIEPKVPVQVDIQYVDGLETSVTAEEAVIGAAHFIDNVAATDAEDNAVELIQDVDTVCDQDGKYVEFTYEQESFSDIGIYVGQKTYDNVPYEMNQTLALPLLRTLSRSTRNGNQLKDIEAHKRLTNNNDGTYTMSLTVKGDSVANEEYNKANILFVMDRSSSMTSNCVEYQAYNGSYQSGTSFYGKSGNNYFALSYNSYTRTWYNGNSPYYGQVYTGTTRLAAEQAAMDVLIQNLLDKNDANTPGKEDLIEISVISFAANRQSGNTEYTNWTTNDYTGLMGAINQTNTPSGTNWEDALIYAQEQAALKKTAQPEEDVYVIFLTDGEPTAVYGETNGAYHYNNTEGGFEYALTEVGGPYNSHGRINDGKNALDRAKEIVDAGHKFYGIFTFNPGEAQTRYLRRLMNFAYTGVDKAYENDATKEDTDIVKKYFTNADTPETLTAAFEKIFADVSSTLGHGDVVIKDGLQAADAMTTTIHADNADGFRYSVTDDETETELYSVTATGSDTNSTVTFHIDGNDYPAGAAKQGVDGKPYYSVTANGTEYKMALADLTGRELKWDLSAIGTLLPGCTYKMDIIVWPNQAAYDYVAGLNNHLPGYNWDPSVESNPDNYHEVTVDGVTYGYYTGGVPGHSSIVKYKDTGVFSVLTNTHQELNYSIVNTKTNEVTHETETTSAPQDPVPLEPQKPMDLVDTSSSVEKQWNIDLDPSIFAQLLYPADGSHYTLTFDVLQDTNTTPYKTLTLGWDSTQNKYVWESDSVRDIEYNQTHYSIGTTWKTDFAVPTGLMLSEARMDALGMDKSAYPSGTYPENPDDPDSRLITYYVLETGHDYTIKERNLSYEFDFNADVFHPMLVDGKMQNVNFTKNGNTVNISKMTKTEGGLSSLKVENTLRGYIHLQKYVVDASNAPVDDDKTKFEYTIELTNDKAPFTGTHIPWYGINGLYYHDADFNYYQVYYENNVLKIKDEAGSVYPVKGSYDVNDSSEQSITFTVGDEDKTLNLWGNQTTASDGNKKASTILQISQGELLSIANIPAGTRYVITETAESGYSLVSINKRIDPNDVQEDPENTTVNIGAGSITGTIVPNHHNYIDYTNRCLITDITIQKTDDEGEGLEGAVFQLKVVSDDGHSEADATTINTISGLGDVVKTVGGETKTFTSSFASTGAVQTLSGLPDGKYRLYEVCIPPGYVSTYRYIQFDIENRVMKNVTTDTGDTSTLDTTENNINLKIKNIPGRELPHTGGMGTRIFYGLGMILVICAGILLVSRRRAGNK